MTTRWDMVDAGKTAVRLGVNYIFGAKPEKGKFIVYSRADIQALKNIYGDMIWDSDLDKGGTLCGDCSGLMTYATGDVVGSSQLYEDALERVPVSQLSDNWEHYIGWVLWLPGHVGIVSDTPNYYYALDGSARNSVHLPLWQNDWKYALKIKGVDYEEDDMRPADVWEYNYKSSAPGGNMYNCALDTNKKVTTLTAQVAALSEAVKVLAESKGADPQAIAKAVDKAVRARLEKIKLNVTAV